MVKPLLVYHFSKNNLHSKGIGNKKNLVGRYYMSHHSGIFLNLDPYNRKKILYKYEKDLDGVYCRRRWWITDTFQRKEKIGNIIFFISHADDPKGIGYAGYIYSFVHLLKFIISLYKKRTATNIQINKNINKFAQNGKVEISETVCKHWTRSNI